MSELAKKLAPLTKPPVVRLDQWLATLDAEDRAAWDAAVLSGVSNAALTEVVRAEGVSANKDTIAKHRRLARERAGVSS